MKKSHLEVADEILEIARKQARKIEENREDILEAFVAKYGFHPDEALQVTGKLTDGRESWQVIHLPKDMMEKTRERMLMNRVSEEPLNWWEKFCVMLARLPKRCFLKTTRQKSR